MKRVSHSESKSHHARTKPIAVEVPQASDAPNKSDELFYPPLSMLEIRVTTDYRQVGF